MNKSFKKLLLGILIFTLIIPVSLAEPPEKKDGNSPDNKMQQQSQTDISFAGMTNITNNVAESNKSYHSITSNKNAILASSGSSTLTNPTITKSGDSSGEKADFYGTNAAVLVYNGATLNINGGTITSDGLYANAVFAYSKGTINISNTNISTTNGHSGGIMVTGGGVLNAKDLTIKTKGTSSAAIRSDRGGGVIKVDGGSYETNGTGSPAIYSTADITVENASLTSTASEGVVIEGANSIVLNNVNLTDTNKTLNGNSETYKNIFLYQSMSGDATFGTSSFKAKDSNIITNNGDTIFVTNTNANIELENNTFTNNDGDFLRIQTGKWGNQGSNGGNVTLNMINQKVGGNIIVDNISTLNMSLTNGSLFSGTIDTINQAKRIELKLSSDSIINLTGDIYVDSLENEDSNNNNIYLNGCQLYVNGNKISANNGKYEKELPTTNNKTEAKDIDNSFLFIVLISVGVLVIALVILGIIIYNKIKNKQKNNLI